MEREGKRERERERERERGREGERGEGGRERESTFIERHGEVERGSETMKIEDRDRKKVKGYKIRMSVELKKKIMGCLSRLSVSCVWLCRQVVDPSWRGDVSHEKSP